MNKAFKQFIKSIKQVEKNKDIFLKASRMERHEGNREPFKAADIIKIIAILGISFMCCTILVLGYLSDNLGTAIFGILAFVAIFGFGALIACGLSD